MFPRVSLRPCAPTPGSDGWEEELALVEVQGRQERWEVLKFCLVPTYLMQ